MSTDAESQRTVRFLGHHADAEPESLTVLDDEMRGYGLDPQEVEREALEFIRDVRRKSRLAGAEARYGLHLERLPALREEARRRMDRAPNARQRLTEILRGGVVDDVQFRNLDTLPEEDLLDMLDEANLLNFLNELDDGEERLPRE